VNYPVDLHRRNSLVQVRVNETCIYFGHFSKYDATWVGNLFQIRAKIIGAVQGTEKVLHKKAKKAKRKKDSLELTCAR
jgi:hypothetical protein